MHTYEQMRDLRTMGVASSLIVLLFIQGCGNDAADKSDEAEASDPQTSPLNLAAGKSDDVDSSRSPWVSTDGTEYNILAIGELYFSKGKERMITIEYLSEDPNNKIIREREFSDLYPLAARNLNLDGFDLVGLIAVDKPPKSSGVQSVSGYRDKRTVEEVRQLLQNP